MFRWPRDARSLKSCIFTALLYGGVAYVIGLGGSLGFSEFQLMGVGYT